MVFQSIIIILFTFMLTGVIRGYALQKNLVDAPNHRSSHTIATPRGGGLAFVVGFLICAWYYRVARDIPFWNFVGFWGAGIGVAMLGFLDDKMNLSPLLRLIGHFILVGFALFCLGGMPVVSFFGVALNVPLVLFNCVAFFYLVWFLNLYNFMDGIDGLAAVEALSICFGGAIIYHLQGQRSMEILPLSLTLAVAGFLFWNFPRARIFMGDAGSCFLGLIIGMFTIQAAHVGSHYFYSWLILSGVFIVDATITLLRRFIAGQRVYHPHRTHAYQNAIGLFQRHFTVTMAVFSINLFWLFPIALLVGARKIDGAIGLCIAYLPLIVLAFQFHAGKSN